MRYLCNKCETTMKENLSDPISWKSKGIVIISLHWESNHFFPRKLLRLLDFVSCSSPMSISFISSCLSFLVCLKALDFKVAISKGATAAASEWSLGQRILCFKCSLDPIKFSLMRETDKKTTKDGFRGNNLLSLWMLAPPGYCFACKKCWTLLTVS